MQADKMEKTGKDNGKDHGKDHGKDYDKDHSKRQKTIHAAIKAPRHDEDEPQLYNLPIVEVESRRKSDEGI